MEYKGPARVARCHNRVESYSFLVMVMVMVVVVVAAVVVDQWSQQP